MIIFEETSRFSQSQQSCVATIGKFDGVHLGHQLILDQLKQKAEQLNLPSLVILIEPHPEEFFAKSDDDCPARLTTLEEKLELLESFGIDFVFHLNFNQAMSELSAEKYIEDILIEGLGVASFIVGNDFRFGHRRAGNFTLLQEKSAEAGFEVIETSAYERNGQRISSTFIREQLANDDFGLVEQLLGRPFSMKGEVEHGQQLGTDLGFKIRVQIWDPNLGICAQIWSQNLGPVLGPQGVLPGASPRGRPGQVCGPFSEEMCQKG